MSDDGNNCAPACTTDHYIGGQAVLEGVMMRGRHCWGLAVRQPSGTIARRSFPLEDSGVRHPWFKWPVVRGVVALVESLTLGVKALGLSASLGLEVEPSDAAGAGESAAEGQAEGVGSPPGTEQHFGFKELALTVGVAAVFAVILFLVIPLAIVKYFEGVFSNPYVFTLVEGLIRIAIFLAYIVGISRIPDLRRVFQYHGAEHKVIHTYESGEKLDPEHAQRYSTLHPRCGTAFLLIVMVVSILVFSVVGKPSLVWLVVSRIVGIPLVAGLAYEIIKYAGRHKDGFVARVVLRPGLSLQRLTTREPSDDQIEVAIAALQEVVQADESREPLPALAASAAGSAVGG
jgi:uncharacterized protein YqhQ